jgi:hypothetical protein
MSSADYAHSGNRLIKMGYCMDFSLLVTMRVMWAGRNEINHSDLSGVMKVTASKLVQGIKTGLFKNSSKAPTVRAPAKRAGDIVRADMPNPQFRNIEGA